MSIIRRRFLDLPDRQIHYRWKEGEASRPALVALHALPGSARKLEPLIDALQGRQIIAPDFAGLGDSDPHPKPAPSIADLADDVRSLIDGLGLETVDLYGSHTGAAVSIELAVTAPDRVRRIVLDGVPLFDADMARELSEKYAPFIEPDHNGSHLLWAHNFCRDMLLFFPWYDKSAGALRSGGGLPDARELHRWVLEVIKGLDSIPHGYRAAFAYPTAQRLVLVRHGTLCITAAADTLDKASRRAAHLLPAGELAEVEGVKTGMAPAKQVAAAMTRFLENRTL